MRALLLALVGSTALAHPRPLPMTYLADTQAKDALEIEQYVDLVPTVARSGVTGAAVGYLAAAFQTELEFGLFDFLELGLYLSFAPAPGDAIASAPQTLQGNGVKQRIKWSLAAPGEWPLDVALYFELAENHREFEVEAKAILQRRLGPVRLLANLSVEREYYWSGQAEWVLNPSVGATVEVFSWLHLGGEYWMHLERPDGAPLGAFNLGPHHYLGPSVLLSFERFWWSTGVYLRLSDTGHVMTPGDLFGAAWIRTVIGVDLN